MVQERLNHCDDAWYALVFGTQDDDPRVAARRIRAHVAKTAIKCQQQSTFGCRCCENVRIAPPAERLLQHGVNVEITRPHDLGDRSRNVLVELDLQRSPARGNTSSLASAAP